MIHPHQGDLKELSDAQLDQKLLKLNSMYFLSNNPDMRQQILLLIDSYKIEMEERQITKRKKMQEEGNDDLDNLINVS